ARARMARCPHHQVSRASAGSRARSAHGVEYVSHPQSLSAARYARERCPVLFRALVPPRVPRRSRCGGNDPVWLRFSIGDRTGQCDGYAVSSGKEPSIRAAADVELHPDADMLRPRVLPALLLDRGRLVKTIKFTDPTYVGDPVNAVRIYNDKEVDELIVIDIEAGRNDAPIPFPLIAEIASEC